ncbi:hypothetical protein [Paenibacillus lignilyticus]|uniref:Type I restriction enzyme R protein N-terminal domain-containing protein n=1 Tax=Paenibacillus lignilyticus TaxID=1172615 RepID=A0ABS5CN73_9BACL|nr:hypothetical protein [Paenibacillus lignilyticus]MBP3967318.1 hypothetical protein [Paenibacillus lignilyticus]
MGSKTFDFLIKNEDRTIAVIEVKNRKNLNIDDAKKVRRNIMAHQGLKSKYFVLVSQEYGYVWDNEKSLQLLDNPLISFSMQDIVSRYYKQLNTFENRLRENELELIVAQWINDLVRTKDNHSFLSEPEQKLVAGGFIDTIHGATVISEVQS